MRQGVISQRLGRRGAGGQPAGRAEPAADNETFGGVRDPIAGGQINLRDAMPAHCHEAFIVQIKIPPP